MTKKYSILLLGFFLAALLTAQNSQAQQGTPTILPFISVSGALDNANVQDEWRFEGEQNQQISLLARATEGDLDLVIVLENADGQLLAANDNATFESTDARIENIPLPNDDVYFVHVYRAGQENGTTSGRYSLDLLHGYSNYYEEQPTAAVAGSGSQDIATIPAVPFYLELEIAMPAATNSYMIEWRIHDPTAITWVFQQFVSGIWVLSVEDSAGNLIRTQNGSTEHLPRAEEEAVFSFLRDEEALSIAVNRQSIARANAVPNLLPLETGQISLNINEPDAPLALLSNIRVTTGFYRNDPFEVGAIPPAATQLNTYNTSPVDVMAELRARELVPPPSATSGLQGDIIDSFILNDAVSFNAYPLIERPFRNFVLAFDASITTGSQDAACGVIFRQTAFDTFATVLFTPERGMYLIQYEEGRQQFAPIVGYESALAPGIGTNNHFLLIVIDDQAQLFINGRLVGAIEVLNEAGLTLLHLVIQSDTLTYCQFDSLWLWSLD